ncbi:hypothetical protein B0J12DRAFT_663164 [Macrophomina phaseolina]|uniref:Putative peptidase domain-containing protein n=1 Tax=Macrophomina phaseolina TaxID=35725 RepID=A0ABQ8GAD6_9PEZI|nr:hypothetical protein B0J12DRAFT_663164 [Macrophomina phaseolina]
MPFLKSLLLGALALSQFTQAIPHPAAKQDLEARKLYSLDDIPVTALGKRALFDVDDISDQNQKTALTQGLKDAVAVAQTVLDKMDTDKHKDKLAKWFGDDEKYPDLVKKVFENFVGENKDNEGAEVLGKVKVHDDDYYKIDGKNFCDIVTDTGKRGTAYYKSRDGKPGMHFCPRYFDDRKNAEDYTKNNCASIAEHINTQTIGRAFQGANVLHEFMHYPRVGKDAIGSQIKDVAYGAYSCYTLKSNEELLKKGKTIENADSYVYYAMHVWLTETCGKDFSYPRNENDD